VNFGARASARFKTVKARPQALKEATGTVAFPREHSHGGRLLIVGSGINGLVAAAMLGKKGKKVLLLERNERIGGCIRSEEITAPGLSTM